MSQSSHSRVIYLLLMSLLCLSISSNLTAQLDNTCSITVNGGISIESSPRPARMSFSVPYLDHSPWSGMENVYLPNNKFTTSTLSPSQKSEMLIINDFDFAIANESIITGIEVRLIGEKTGIDTVKDKRIQLVNDMGAMIGQNKANKAIYGNEWNQDSLTNKGNWIYGSNQDTWEANLTPQIINSPSFGLALQVQNIGSEEAKIMLDQVMIRIYYIPAIDICQQHACMSIYTVPEDNVVDYDWTVSSGLEHQDSTNAPYVINIYADQSPFGSYEVCLTKTYRDGQQSNCCRNIIYRPCESGSIGDYVWKDTNGNGNQDAGEPGLDDIRVFLFNESEEYLEESITQNGGQYRFENVVPGNYFVHVSNYDYCPTIGIGNSDNTDSDFLQAISPLMSKLVTVAPSQSVANIDFGLINKGTISGLAWIDVDGSGDVNSIDILAEGIEVQLQYQNGDVIKSSVTREDGSYTFQDVPPGDYIVYFAFDPLFTNTTNGVSLIDSEFKTPVVMLENGGDLMDVNAGVYRLSTIGDFVWFDANENGIFDNNEAGLADMTVMLENCLGQELGSVMTNANGNYMFQGVPPGDYIACIESNRPDLRPLETASVSVNGSRACSDCLTVNENSSVQNMDFAMINAFIQIDVNVWFDNDSDGIIGTNEQFANGAEVTIFDCNNNEVETTTTNADGLARFQDLLTGDYYARVISPNGEEFSLASFISNANGLGTTDCINIVPLGITLNLGLIQTSSVGDYVWEDLNRDGVQGQDEPGIENVTVSLTDCNGNLIAETMTSASGEYAFIDIIPGEYIICTNYTNIDYTTTIAGAGTTDSDSDFDAGNIEACSACINLIPNVTRTDIDFGYVRKQSTVIVNVWEDLNYNAANDIENAIPSVAVSIYNCTGQLLRTTNTGTDGIAEFSGLFLEEFYIEVSLDDGLSVHPNGSFSNANGFNTTDCFVLEETGTSIGVPVVQLPSVGNFVWQDRNRDGIQNTDEPGLANVLVSLEDCNGVLINQVSTDVDGSYLFENVIPGDYLVCLGDPGDFFEPTISTNDNATNSDFDLAIGTLCSSCFTANAFEDNLDIDFGFIRDVSEVVIELWYDDDGDGVFDNSEDGAENIEVVLLDCAGIEVATATSNTIGEVSFINVGLGDYYIQIEEQSGFDFSTLTSITGGNGIGTSDCFTVDLNGEELEVALVSNLSNILVELWLDNNGDGRFDSDEDGVVNTEVILFDCLGNQVAVASSNSEGEVNFTDIQLGEYYIQVDGQAGFDYSPLTSINGSNGSGTSDCFELGLTGAELEVAFIGPASIGDFVWLDVNDNGRQDDDEPGVEGINLNLLNMNGVIQQTVTSDANGQYLFEDLQPGLYRIILVGLDASFTLTRSGQANENIDSDFEMVNTLISTSVLTLNSNESNLDIDLGLVPSPSGLTGTVWRDGNGNMLNDNEQGQEGILVLLYDCEEDNVYEIITDGFGNFNFDFVPVGEYYIDMSFSDATDYIFIEGGESDVTNANGPNTTDCFVFDAVSFVPLMIGATPMSAMRTQVFIDENENGILENTDSNLPNVSVILRDMSDNEMDIQKTNAQGEVSFENIYPGQYRLELVELDLGLAPTLEGASTEATDSDLLLEGGRFLTDVINMFNGVANEEVDLGLVWLTKGKISGDVFRDSNGDLDSENESGIENSVINLYNCDNVLYATTETDANGHFEFIDVDQGEYFVKVEILDNYKLESGNNSDFTSINSQGETICFLVDNTSQIKFEAAMIPLSSVGDFLWLDQNLNGQQDTNELGVPFKQIHLLDNNNEILSSTFTNSDGFYSFEDLLPGNYRIELIGLESEYDATIKAVGSSDLDSDLESDNGRLITDEIYLSDGVNNDNIDMGLVSFSEGKISGIVFSDFIGDLVKDVIDEGIENLTISLFNCDNSLYNSTETDSKGEFEFVDIDPGEYFIQVELLDNFKLEPGSKSQLTSFNEDGQTICVTIDEGFEVYFEAAMIPLSSVGDFVWLDENINGRQDQNELGIANMELHLLGENDEILSTTFTDNSGAYMFEGIVPGFYKIELIGFEDVYNATMPNLASNDLDSDLINEGGRLLVQVFTLVDGINFTDLDMGLTRIQTIIGGVTFNDINQDGIRDSGELGIEDVEILLLDESRNEMLTTKTNSDGVYNFIDIPTGDYIVKFENLDDLTFSPSFVGSDELYDSDVVNDDGETELISVNGGGVIEGINAGYFDNDNTSQQLSIDGFVWEDINGNGLLDLTNESGLNGIIVNLYSSNDVLVTSMMSRDRNDGREGYYHFDNLTSGEYYVAFELLSDAIITKSFVGNSSDIDSDVTSDYRTDIISLTSSFVENINAGFYFGSSIGDYVWMDVNDNGSQDIGEVGANDFIIRLVDNNNNLVATTFSVNGPDGPGYYQFEDVAPGNYYVRIDLQLGIVFSQALTGGINIDSDITNENGPGTTYNFDIRSGQSIQNVDLGLVPQSAQVGDRVWEDYNANGVQDDNEPGVNDVTVQLFKSDGTMVAETITATVNFIAGYYRFSDVQPGEYYIGFVLEEDYNISPSNRGGDDSADSDIESVLGEATTSIFELSSGEVDLDVDGGIYVPSQIGDLVWIDTNLNGQQDPSEVGEEGIEVKLYSDNDELIATTFTDNDGKYLFNEIIEGSYYLEFVIGTNMSFTEREKGGDTNLDSNVDESGRTEVFALGSREVRRDFDAGLVFPVNLIGGQTWLDVNSNGIIETDDDVLSGVTVWLLDATASFVLDETVSDENGNYIFYDLNDGTYVIQFIPMTGLSFAGQDFGSDDKLDSDCDAFGYTGKMILSGGTTMNKYVSGGYVDITKKSLTNVYPNPVSGSMFKLDVKNVFDEVPLSYTIYNNQGNVVSISEVNKSLRAGEYTYEVPLEGLDAGMYLIKVRIRNVTEYHKLMVFK